MSSTIDPTESIFGAFYEMGKRVFVFIACIVLGSIQGFSGALLDQAMSKDKENQESPTTEIVEDDEWFEPSLVSLASEMPDVVPAAIGVSGCILSCYGAITIIKGNEGTFSKTTSTLGGSFLGLLLATEIGGNIGQIAILSVIILLIVSIAVFLLIKRKQTKAWEHDLQELKEQNDKKRDDNTRLIKEIHEGKKS